MYVLETHRKIVVEPDVVDQLQEGLEDVSQHAHCVFVMQIGF